MVKKIDLFLKVELSGLAGFPFMEAMCTGRRVFFMILVIKTKSDCRRWRSSKGEIVQYLEASKLFLAYTYSGLIGIFNFLLERESGTSVIRFGSLGNWLEGLE